VQSAPRSTRPGLGRGIAPGAGYDAEGHPVSDDRKPDPQADAERKLRLVLAAEARAERKLRSQIQKGFYGCLTIVVLLFLLVLFLS
jgi:hypothetical protein